MNSGVQNCSGHQLTSLSAVTLAVPPRSIAVRLSGSSLQRAAQSHGMAPWTCKSPDRTRDATCPSLEENHGVGWAGGLGEEEEEEEMDTILSSPLLSSHCGV